MLRPQLPVILLWLAAAIAPAPGAESAIFASDFSRKADFKGAFSKIFLPEAVAWDPDTQGAEGFGGCVRTTSGFTVSSLFLNFDPAAIAKGGTVDVDVKMTARECSFGFLYGTASKPLLVVFTLENGEAKIRFFAGAELNADKYFPGTLRDTQQEITDLEYAKWLHLRADFVVEDSLVTVTVRGYGSQSSFGEDTKKFQASWTYSAEDSEPYLAGGAEIDFRPTTGEQGKEFPVFFDNVAVYSFGSAPEKATIP